MNFEEMSNKLKELHQNYKKSMTNLNKEIDELNTQLTNERLELLKELVPGTLLKTTFNYLVVFVGWSFSDPTKLAVEAVINLNGGYHADGVVELLDSLDVKEIIGTYNE